MQERERGRKKGRKEKKKERENVCPVTAQFQSNVICTSHAPTRTKMVRRATHTNTVDDSPLYVQLFTCRIQFQARMSTKSSEPVLEGGRRKLVLPSCVTCYEKRAISRHRPRQIKVDTFHRLCTRCRVTRTFASL